MATWLANETLVKTWLVWREDLVSVTCKPWLRGDDLVNELTSWLRSKWRERHG